MGFNKPPHIKIIQTLLRTSKDARILNMCMYIYRVRMDLSGYYMILIFKVRV